jgi:hypothetical protein
LLLTAKQLVDLARKHIEDQQNRIVRQRDLVARYSLPPWPLVVAERQRNAPVSPAESLRESRIEQVAAVISRGWKDGECQIAKKVDPNRSAKMADQIKAMMSALTGV